MQDGIQQVAWNIPHKVCSLKHLACAAQSICTVTTSHSCSVLNWGLVTVEMCSCTMNWSCLVTDDSGVDSRWDWSLVDGCTVVITEWTWSGTKLWTRLWHYRVIHTLLDFSLVIAMLTLNLYSLIVKPSPVQMLAMKENEKEFLEFHNGIEIGIWKWNWLLFHSTSDIISRCTCVAAPWLTNTDYTTSLKFWPSR